MLRVLYLIEILHQTTTSRTSDIRRSQLYLIEILHQTTTGGGLGRDGEWLYLIEILHQTTTFAVVCISVPRLYLIEILHQTTTSRTAEWCSGCCILSKFYIKPQRKGRYSWYLYVVSYRNSTSNHNRHSEIVVLRLVVSYRNSTSNHNVGPHIDW